MVRSLLGIFALRSFAWNRLLENFRLGSRLGTFVWDSSLGCVRLVSVARNFIWKLLRGHFRLGTFAREVSPGNLRYLLLGDDRLGTFAWELSLGNCCLGTSACEAGGTAFLFGWGEYMWIHPRLMGRGSRGTWS